MPTQKTPTQKTTLDSDSPPSDDQGNGVTVDLSDDDTGGDIDRRNPVEALASAWLERSRQAGTDWHAYQASSGQSSSGQSSPGKSSLGQPTLGGAPHEGIDSQGGEASLSPQHANQEANSGEIDGLDAAAELESLLPVIKRLESARRMQEERPAGLATLGASRPKQLGDFRIIRQIGRGGMGVVFEAEQVSLGRTVAIKVLPQSMFQEDRQVDRFRVEAKLAASLHHTNIVPVFGFGEDQGYHFYVMQRIDGGGLDRVRLTGKSLPVPVVTQIGIQAASALSHAHGQGVLHRDIKPANLLLDRNQKLWITDFGVAKAIESVDQTRTNDVVGTLRYMAPEHFLDAATERSDVYSLGLTLYELLAGRPAIEDAKIRSAMMRRQPIQPPVPIRKINPDVHRDLETILQKAMAQEESDRYQNAEALGDDLERFIEGQPIRARRHSIVEVIWRMAKRKPAVAALTALSTLLLITIALVASTGYLQVQHSLGQAVASKKIALSTADVATDALNQLFERFSDDDWLTQMSLTDEGMMLESSDSAPAVSAETAVLLQDLLGYYDRIASTQSAYFRSESGDADATQRSNENLRSVATARLHIGGIHRQLGNHEAAANAYFLALADFRSLRLKMEEPITSLSVAREAELLNRIGSAWQRHGDVDKAQQFYSQAMSVVDDAPTSVADSPQCQFVKARTHFLRGLRIFPGATSDSMPPPHALSFGRFRQLLGPLGRKMSRPGFGPPPGISQRGLSPGASRSLQNEDESKDEHQSSDSFINESDVGLASDAPQSNDNGSKTNDGRLESDDQLVDSIFGAWPQRPQTVDPAHAEKFASSVEDRRQELVRAVSILESLAMRYPGRPAYSLQLARVLREKSVESRDANHGDKEPSVSEAIEILTRLYREYPNNARVRWELISVLSHWDVFRMPTRERIDHVIEQLQRASELIEDLVSKNPGIDEYVAQQSHIDFRLGVLVQRSGDLLERRRRMEIDYQSSVAFRRAVDASATLVRRNPDAAGYRAWHATFLMWLGDSLIRIGESNDAITQFNKSVENWVVVDEQTGAGAAKLGLDRAEMALMDLLRF